MIKVIILRREALLKEPNQRYKVNPPKSASEWNQLRRSSVQ